MKNPTKNRVTLFLKFFPVILALGFLARALPPGASAQGYVSAVPPAPASGQTSADNATGVPAGITDVLTPLIQEFTAKHPWVAVALSAMVLLRVALKPAMSLIEAMVASDPAEAEALANFEAGPWFHLLAWFLDYAASIKLKACLVRFGRDRQSINCRYLALAGLLISLTGCVTSNVLAGHYVESITTRGLGVDVSATTSSTGTPRVYFGAFSETVTFMPTETNGTIATPNYANNLESQSTWNPLGQGINESIVSGSDQAWAGTNVSAQPIIAKVRSAEFGLAAGAAAEHEYARTAEELIHNKETKKQRSKTPTLHDSNSHYRQARKKSGAARCADAQIRNVSQARNCEPTGAGRVRLDAQGPRAGLSGMDLADAGE